MSPMTCTRNSGARRPLRGWGSERLHLNYFRNTEKAMIGADEIGTIHDKLTNGKLINTRTQERYKMNDTPFADTAIPNKCPTCKDTKFPKMPGGHSLDDLPRLGIIH